MKKMFSPTYVFLGTFFGSPLTAIYMLCQNNKAMGVKEQNKAVILTGLLLSIVILVIFNLVIDPSTEIKNINNVTLFQFSYIAAILFLPAFIYERYVAKKQLTKKSIRASETYIFRPLWQIIFVTLCGFIVFNILNVTIILILESLNIVDATL